MPRESVTDEKVRRVLTQCKSVDDAAAQLGFTARWLQARMARMKAQGVVFDRPSANSAYVGGQAIHQYAKAYPKRIKHEIKDGVVLIGSDIHIWPGFESTAQRAFELFCKRMKPSAIVLNGDIFDFAAISRHHRIGWSEQPMPMEEIKAAEGWIGRIEKAAPGATLFRTPGNHCLRLEGWLSNRAAEVEGMPGSKIAYYMPRWKAAWAIHFNNTLWVTHRLKGGKHAPYRNALETGQNTCTGHLHNQQVRDVTDLNGTRTGVDTGCMAEPFIEDDWPQFEYLEGSPADWRAGFGVFTFEDYQLADVELVKVPKRDEIRFRGKREAV